MSSSASMRQQFYEANPELEPLSSDDFISEAFQGANLGVYSPRGNVNINARTSECSLLPTEQERVACLSRLLHGYGDGAFQVHRTLGRLASPDEQHKTPAPEQPFTDVRGVVMDDKRTGIDAVVMKDGTRRRLPVTIPLPPSLIEQQRNHAYAMADQQLAREIALQQENVAIDHEKRARELAQRINKDASRLQAAAHKGVTHARRDVADASQLEKESIEAETKAHATSTTLRTALGMAPQENANVSSTVPQAPAMVLPPVPLAPPMINGALPVVTPLTRQDAIDLRREVANADLLSEDQHTRFKQELSAAKEAHEKHEHVIKTVVNAAATATPPSPSKNAALLAAIQRSGQSGLRPTESPKNKPDDVFSEIKKNGQSGLRHVDLDAVAVAKQARADSDMMASNDPHTQLMRAVQARAAQRAAQPHDHFIIKSGNQLIPVTQSKGAEAPVTAFALLQQEVAKRRASIQDETSTDSDDEFDDSKVQGGDESDEDEDEQSDLDVSIAPTRSNIENLHVVLSRHGHVHPDPRRMDAHIGDELYIAVMDAYHNRFFIADIWTAPSDANFRLLAERVRDFGPVESRRDRHLKARIAQIVKSISAMPIVLSRNATGRAIIAPRSRRVY